jgi:hypothetical protein
MSLEDGQDERVLLLNACANYVMYRDKWSLDLSPLIFVQEAHEIYRT